jgi:hypothetical protein
MDNEAQAKHIARFLPAFFAFESEQLRAGASVLAIDAMGWGLYRVIRDGRVREFFGTIFAGPDLDFDAYLSPGSSFLRVENLWDGATIFDLLELFSPFGTIRYHLADHESQFSPVVRSCSLVMGTASEARAAVANLHEREFHGQRLKITQPSGIGAWGRQRENLNSQRNQGSLDEILPKGSGRLPAATGLEPSQLASHGTVIPSPIKSPCGRLTRVGRTHRSRLMGSCLGRIARGNLRSFDFGVIGPTRLSVRVRPVNRTGREPLPGFGDSRSLVA